MRYMFSKCDAGLPSVLFAIPDGSLIIPPELVNRWYRQMSTPYDELPENEKPSDREQADKILAIISPAIDVERIISAPPGKWWEGLGPEEPT